MVAGELELRLVRFGAAVAEERAGEAGTTHELGRELDRALVVDDVRDVDQRPRLLRDRTRELGVAVADGGDRDPADEVEVLVAVSSMKKLLAFQTSVTGDGEQKRCRYRGIVASVQ